MGPPMCTTLFEPLLRGAFWLIAAALLGACATGPAQETGSADTQHCSFEPRIGTSIPSTQCVTRTQRENDRRDGQQTVETLRRAPARPSAGGSGVN